jgi:DNA replication protein DnaC
VASDLISPTDAGRIHDEYLVARVHAGIPTRFAARIDVPPAVRAWLEDPTPNSLYLTGGVGTGKTHAAFEVLRLLREAKMAPAATGNSTGDEWIFRDAGIPVPPRARDAEVWRATTLLDRMRPGSDDARSVVDICQRAGLLLLDDLGAEKPSEWTQERLYELIDERYAWQRPLIVTSNVPPKALAEWVGDRVASRLAEMCVVVALTGPDRRRP